MVRRCRVCALIILVLLLPGCAATKLAKVTVVAKAFTKVGGLKKLGFGTAVVLASRAEHPVGFVASKGMDGLDALCMTQDFLDWVDKPGRGGEAPPPEVVEAMKRAFPGARAASDPRRFADGFWAQNVSMDGQRYVIVHRDGQTSILAEEDKGPPLAIRVLYGLGYFFCLLLVVWAISAVVMYLRKGSMGALSPSRLASSYVEAVSPKPASERTNAILGMVVCLFMVVYPIYHHFWIKQVLAAPIIRAADELKAVDWGSGQLIRLRSEPGPTLRGSDEEEYQLRIVGDLAMVAYFDDMRLSKDKLLVGYAKPFPPGLVEPVENRSKAIPIGMVDCLWVDVTTGSMSRAIFFSFLGLCGLIYFGRKARRSGHA